MEKIKISAQGITAVISLLSALGVAFIGYMSVGLQTDVQNLDKKIKHEELMLEIKKFEANQKKEKDELIKSYVPKLVNGDEQEKNEVLALLFVLYPNDVGDILSRIGVALNQEKSDSLAIVINKASQIDKATGEWGILISSDGSSEDALHEVARATSENYSSAIYKRGKWFATVVGPFPNKEDAERANIAIKRKMNDTAFIINYKKWCGKQVKADGYIECKA